MASRHNPAFLNNAPWRRSTGRGQQEHAQSVTNKLWGCHFTEELACLLPAGLAASEFPPLHTTVRSLIPKTRRRSEMFRQPTRSPTRSSRDDAAPRAPQEAAAAGRPQPSPRARPQQSPRGRPRPPAEGERNKRASAPAVVAAETDASCEAHAPSAPEEEREHQARPAAPLEGRAELQARKSLRVLDLVAAASASSAAREAVASFSSLAQTLAKKESRRVLRKELRELADRQEELLQLLRKLAPSAAGAAGAACDPAEQLAATLLVLRAAPGASDETDAAGDCNTSDMEADDGRGEWVLEPPHSECWDWPLSRLERKERIIMLDQMALREDNADLRHQLARRRR